MKELTVSLLREPLKYVFILKAITNNVYLPGSLRREPHGVHHGHSLGTHYDDITQKNRKTYQDTAI
jgi:hypothetical protein